jgi:hypothetical protein
MRLASMTPADDDQTGFYQQHIARLVTLAESEGVAEDVAEQLAHDVLMLNIRRLASISDLDRHLDAAMRDAIRRVAGNDPE